jgi:hypothetical protein
MTRLGVMAVGMSNRGLAMVRDLPVRLPGASVPDAIRDAAAKAARGRGPVDAPVLKRVRDALARLPDSALGRYYFEIPGDCLASPRQEGQ